MIFVDTNVFMYAVGRAHALKDPARLFLTEAQTNHDQLCCSAEVLQELLHAYLPVNRLQTLTSAFSLIQGCVDRIWPVEPEDVELARTLIDKFSHLDARDLLHLACCRRRNVLRIKTFDRALAAAFA